MNAQHRRSILVVAMIALLMVMLGWSWGRYAQSRRQAKVVAAQTARCHELAALIEEARRQAAITQTHQPINSQIIQLIQESARQVGIDPQTHILDVQPRADRILKNSPYRQGFTELRLDGLSRRQFVELLHQLITTHRSIHVDSMRLSFNDSQLSVDSLVLTYLVLAD
jgi:hypothetical protein